MRPVNLAVFTVAIPLHTTRNMAAWYFSLPIIAAKYCFLFFFCFLIQIFLADWGEDMLLQLKTHAHSTFNIIHIYIMTKDHFYITIYPVLDRVFAIFSCVTYIAFWHISKGEVSTRLLTTISHEFVMLQIAKLRGKEFVKRKN